MFDMKIRFKRCFRISFFLAACVVIAISLFRQLIYFSEKIKLSFKHIPLVKVLHFESDGIKYDVDGDWFSLSNIEGSRESLKYTYNVSKSWSSSNKFLLPIIENSSISDYIKLKRELCGGAFICYAQSFAVLTDVLLDPSKGVGRHGGENISDVINQDEESEYYKLSKGYFNLNCGGDVAGDAHCSFGNRDHLKKWMSAMNFQSSKLSSRKRMKRTTIVVQRYEYVNLYHTMTDFYNVFLMYLIFDLDPDSNNILWLDGHPFGGLDTTWKTLFGHVIRAGNIKKPVLLKTMIWNIMGYNSPLNQHDRDDVPFLEDFRHFFLARHDVVPSRKLNCSAITVSFIWRRDYLAHPRNPKGTVQRKIENEDELISTLKSAFPTHKINGYQLDSFPMHKQLQHIVETDIFIGMHGAGLTHTLFLPQHAALVELFPAPGSTAGHFKSMARWRGLRYVRWFSKGGGDPKGYTNVNPKVISEAVKELTDLMCSNEKTDFNVT